MGRYHHMETGVHNPDYATSYHHLAMFSTGYLLREIGESETWKANVLCQQ